jgi:hypothetical protein
MHSEEPPAPIPIRKPMSAEENNHDVTTLSGLEAAIYRYEPREHHNFAIVTGTHCPTCGGTRRMALSALYWQNLWAPHRPRRFQAPIRTGMGELVEESPETPEDFPPADEPEPAIYSAVCLQCDHIYLIVVHPGPNGVEIAALPSSYGGLATPRTPKAVAYYLDQANRARSVGALSAAAAMYRAALDQLLFHEGFQNGTLGVKLRDLEAASPPPPWYSDLDPAYLTVINLIGSGAIHPNDGNVDRQKVIDRKITEAVDALFTEILDLIYERPGKKKERLSRAQQVAEHLKRDGAPIADEDQAAG